MNLILKKTNIDHKKVKVIYIDRNLNWTYINYLPEDFKYNYKINNRGSLEDFKGLKNNNFSGKNGLRDQLINTIQP